jgi:hypothetical protein
MLVACCYTIKESVMLDRILAATGYMTPHAARDEGFTHHGWLCLVPVWCAPVEGGSQMTPKWYPSVLLLMVLVPIAVKLGLRPESILIVGQEIGP